MAPPNLRPLFQLGLPRAGAPKDARLALAWAAGA